MTAGGCVGAGLLGLIVGTAKCERYVPEPVDVVTVREQGPVACHGIRMALEAIRRQAYMFSVAVVIVVERCMVSVLRSTRNQGRALGSVAAVASDRGPSGP